MTNGSQIMRPRCGTKVKIRGNRDEGEPPQESNSGWRGYPENLPVMQKRSDEVLSVAVAAVLRAPADAELNATPLAPAEPSPYLYATSTPDTSAFTYDKVMAATVDERACVIFMMRHGLISRTMLCRHCDDEMSMDAPAGAGTAVAKIGGPGNIVEINETSLKKKSKYGRDLQHPDNWLFGGVDRTTNLWFGILTGADCKKKTLSPILRKHVKAKPTIISDAYASYVSVNDKKSTASCAAWTTPTAGSTMKSALLTPSRGLTCGVVKRTS
ncbi:unnamed protein product [Phytophthora fragariaefolia]|uniref:Unnamed protein product n=1 Tax=Phytophthora fragariaefolia TaxID=1490495 RepID=A0A9W7D5M1_9STRA|nr:unnamed protein product [Phytophthora fragariaefolia]